jgi:ubiquinone/menaquinone biosynthesis C-methylase UbiE
MEKPHESISWEKDSIDKGPERGRSLEDYERMLGFEREELRGKTILDLGAGPEGRLGQDIHMDWESKLDLKIISLSPDFAHKKYEFVESPIPGSEKQQSLENPTAGLAEQLPFTDKSFDETLALYSVSQYAEENFKMWIPEICRTLKDNGIARIGPFIKNKHRQEIEELIQNLGYRSEFIRRVFTGGAMGFTIPIPGDVLIIYKEKPPNSS